MVSNLYEIYVGGDRKNWRNRIQVKAGSRQEAKKKAWAWLGDTSRVTRLSARLALTSTRFYDEVPPADHPLHRSAA